MNSHSAGAHIHAGERVLMAALLALCGVLVLWELWLAPIRPGGSWLVLKTLPLLCCLPGILRRRPYTFQWLSLLLPWYLGEGIVRAWSEPGRVRALAIGEIVLALIVFAAILAALRRRNHPTGRYAG